MGMPKAKLILRGGKIFLGQKEGYAEELAVWDDKVLATGKSGDAENLIGDETKVIELNGRCAVPGFNDAHQHQLSIGLSMKEVNLKDHTKINNMDKLLAEVKAKVDATPDGEWVFGRGYDNSQLEEDRHPLMEEIDKISPNNPVYLKRTCGHVGVGNSLAFKLSKVDESTPDPQGGVIEKQNGRLTGRLDETAQRLVMDVIPAKALDELIAAVHDGSQFNLSNGITSAGEPGVGLREGYIEFDAYREAHRRGLLKCRTYMMILGGQSGWAEKAIEMGLKTGDGDEMLRVGPMKFFTDGSAGGETAWMTQPYLSDKENLGLSIYTDEQADDMAARYYAAGWQVCAHGIGDAALDQLVNAYERAMGNDVRDDKRFRIEHCGFLRPDLIERMKRLGVMPVPQPIFMYEFGDLYEKVLGRPRAETAYPMKTFLEEGLHPSASSDCPVSSLDPYRNIFTMITRQTSSGNVMGEGERLTLEEALHVYTYNGAYQSFEEDIKGRLIPGQLADIVVPSRDLFDATPDEIHQSKTDLAIVGGNVEFDRLGEAA